MATNREFPKDPMELGALWLKNTKKGEILTGTLTVPPDVTGLSKDLLVDVVCWPVRSQNPAAPVWRVKRALPRPEAGDAPSHAPARSHEPVSAPDEEDIPF